MCSSVSYYRRRSGLFQHLSVIPYIVKTRRSPSLLSNLQKNDYPIFFDGLHTTFYLNDPELINRKKLVRLHNIEHNYYRSLSKYESNIVKKIYFFIESVKLKRYEKVILKADIVFPISGSEQSYFENRYHNSTLLSPFHPFDKVSSQTGKGDYIIYHGDLSVNENIEIVKNLISNVFSKISHPCIIAGKNPNRKILREASRFSNIHIVSNPDDTEMSKLIKNAHIQLLPTLDLNGFKLKLLFGLFGGRYCISNSDTTGDPELISLYDIASSNAEYISIINRLMKLDFSSEMILKRQKLLVKKYKNEISARELIGKAFSID